jgi:glyoxylase-like metal-dependent hydrolase (beta-lactamase superfamily II)
VLIVGDALTHPVFSFQKPQWFGANDIDAEVAAQTRVKLLDRLATDNALMVAYHLPNHGLGRVESSGGQYRFTPEVN